MRELSAQKRLFYIIALAIGGTIIANLIGGLVMIFATVGNSYDTTLSRPLILCLQAIVQIFTFFIPAYIYIRIQKKKIAQSLDLNKNVSFSMLVPTVGILLLSIPVIDFLSVINKELVLPQSMSGLETIIKSLEASAMKMTETMLNTTSYLGLFNNIIVIALLASVGEEILFRGIIQKTLVEIFKNIHVAVIITAIVFSIIHFQFYGFLPRFFLGLILGYIYVYTRNLWFPIVIHFLNNAFAAVVYFLWKKGMINMNPLTDTSVKPEYITVIFAILAIVLIMDYIRKKNIDKIGEP